mgnify:CR=1 FL=1
MARLEYHRLDDAKGYELLYYYENITREEIAARFACDYFIKEKVVYEKTSCAIEASVYVVYVQEDNEAAIFENAVVSDGDGIKLELRHFKENSTEYPLVHLFQLPCNEEVLLYLLSDYLLWMGQEWRKTSVEIDEDRKVYVYYGEPVLEEGKRIDGYE